jgi:hypothetical protein
MTSKYEFAEDPRKYAEHVLVQSETLLNEAVAIAFPEQPSLNPLLAFPKPNEVRAESPNLPELSDQRKSILLSMASELGFGRPENVTLSEQGLIGATVIIEGGQPHKMLAEGLMVVGDEQAQPKLIIISASPHRVIDGVAEVASAERLFGRAGKTEYDVALDVARALPGFTEYPEHNVLAASYDIDNNFAVSQELTGQFKSVGAISGTPIVLMQINRRELADKKYDRQPGTANVIAIVDAFTRAAGDESSAIVNVTSGTYRPSRTIGVALAGLSANRPVGIATYGNDLLNYIKGEDAPAPIGQLPSELHVMSQQLVKLDEALRSQDKLA